MIKIYYYNRCELIIFKNYNLLLQIIMLFDQKTNFYYEMKGRTSKWENNLSDFLVHSMSEEEFLILTIQEGWQNNKNLPERVQNSKWLLSLINCNCYLTGEKIEDLYVYTVINSVRLCLSSCTSLDSSWMPNVSMC